MTSMLEKAFILASELTEDEQNALASWVLEELKSEKKWKHVFENSQNELAKLAEQALLEESQDKTKDMDINKL